MATLTDQGIDGTSFQEYKTDLEEVFTDALGDDVDLAGESLQGEIINSLASAFFDIDQVVVAVGNALSLDRSRGAQLDNLGSLFSLDRVGATATTADVTLTGADGTVVPDLTRFRTGTGNIFFLDGNVLIGATGTATGNVYAQVSGPVLLPANVLTSIVDSVAGLASVNNAAAGVVGTTEETDDTYRRRFKRHIARNSTGILSAIEAALLEVDDVTRVRVIENDTSADVTTRGLTVGDHSIGAIVEGGTNADIGRVLAIVKAGGIGTSGDTSVSVPHPTQGFNTTIEFQRVNDIQVSFAGTVTQLAGFPTDGETQIENAAIAYFDELIVGGLYDSFRFQSALAVVPGFSLSAVTVAGIGGVDLATIDIFDNLVLQRTNITLTITT